MTKIKSHATRITYPKYSRLRPLLDFSAVLALARGCACAPCVLPLGGAGVRSPQFQPLCSQTSPGTKIPTSEASQSVSTPIATVLTTITKNLSSTVRPCYSFFLIIIITACLIVGAADNSWSRSASITTAAAPATNTSG